VTNPFSSGSDAELRARVAEALAPGYSVESEIGRGGMGIVYRARDQRLKRTVAVKLLPPELAFRADIRSRFLREAEMAAGLNHPHIVPIYTVDERHGLVYFVMALVEGESVGDRLKRAGRMPVPEAQRILRQVADALAYAHAHGVVHRDIKPDNILLDRHSGRAMVTDFGIARAASEGESRLTATGVAIGTPQYMSPEQCSGERDIDGRSDLYSLGAVAYQMLAGEPPFTGSSTPAIFVKQVTEKPVPLRDRVTVPANLEQIVMRLLEKEPANRFANGAALVAALDGAPLTPLPSVPAVRETAARERERPLTRFEKRQLERQERWAKKQERIHRKLQGLGELEHLGGLARLGELGMKLERSIPDRIRSFRRRAASYVGTIVFLFAINAATSPHFWWAIFPALGMLLGLSKGVGELWADGVRLSDIFSGSPLIAGGTAAGEAKGALAAGTAPNANPPARPPELGAELGELVRVLQHEPRAARIAEELNVPGPIGDTLRQAVNDNRAVHDGIARLGKEERAMLPDVKGTADALFDRIVALAGALQRLDAEIGPNRLSALDERIARIQTAGEGASDGERRLGLLRRQREMLAELVRSRESLHEQLESAGLLMQNLALDLLKLRSSGVQSGLAGVTSATQEARALAKEIGYVLDAASELRALESRDERAGA
jgi:serine/threonine-protein kinase